MDSKHFQRSSRDSSTYIDPVEVMKNSTSNEHLPEVSNSSKSNIITWSYDRQVCQIPQSPRGEHGDLFGDTLRYDSQQQKFRSITPTFSTASYPHMHTMPITKKRSSSVEKGKLQSSGKPHMKHHESLTGNVDTDDVGDVPTTSCISTAFINVRMTNRSVKDRSFHDDKENELPKTIDVMNSPKMNISEQALAEQNSPIMFEHTKRRFSFSPKQLLYEDIACGSTLPLFGHIAETCNNFSNSINVSSPLLSSAVYRSGNYFKFPEVDSLTQNMPSNVYSIGNSFEISATQAKNTAISSSATAEDVFSSVIQKHSPETSGNRRVRLKSISLDSECARLVEENLGIPVEELIEYANVSTKNQNSKDDSHVGAKNVIHLNAEEEEARLLLCEEEPAINPNDAMQNLISNSSFLIRPKGERKNKNKLKIDINKEINADKLVSHDNTETNHWISMPTPKTPTLTQSKQKAVSLDSSDANNTCYYSIPSMHNNQIYQDATSDIKSANSLSSVSVPSTPKRYMHVSRRKLVGQCTALTKSCALKNPSQKNTAIVPAVTASDCCSHHSNPVVYDDRSLRIAIDFDNLGECAAIGDNNIENYYLGEISDDVVVFTDNDIKNCFIDQTEQKKRYKAGGKATEADLQTNIGDYSLLGTNLQTQKFGMMSLSNNNLETLPEVMTNTDLDTSSYDNQEDRCCEAAEESNFYITKPSYTRSNILQRRGSNQSLTISLNINGSLGNLTQCMSASNYSLGSFNGSTYNLSACPQHQHNMYPQAPSNASSTQSIVAHSQCSSQSNILLPHLSPFQQQNYFEIDGDASDLKSSKKNILQRRGSNTSLTLNIKGSNSPNLSRFSSQSSLNISATYPTPNLGSVPSKAKLGQNTHGHAQQPQQYYQSQSLKQPQINKKGLLERRNSNTSLTLNIHSNGLGGSNYNLRSSASSLNNIANASSESFDRGTTQLTQNCNPEDADCKDIKPTGPMERQHQRKFLSSENLNSMAPQCTKLNQTHFRNSTKTCFGSVSDLKPNISSNNDSQANKTHEQDVYSNSNRHFDQSSLCSCTGVRNITTKPLSPQSTSEDFKMYLANIQLLQNATNILTEEKLRKLHFVFGESYETHRLGWNSSKYVPICTGFLAKTNGPQRKYSNQKNPFHLELLPNDEEKKHLLRSLHEEFWDLPTNHQEKPLVFGSQPKNRYKTILPNEHSRVVLRTDIGSQQEHYINANYIKGPDYVQNSYIVTQGPLPNTIYDYWLMVQQNSEKPQRRSDQCVPGIHADKISFHSQKIVMLTNFVENSQQKCSVYFPTELNQIIFVTDLNEKFENATLAEFYETYLNPVMETNPLHDYDFELNNDNNEYQYIPSSDVFLGANEEVAKNFFLIKNCGLHEKDGFSIRKLACLYVVNIFKDGLLDDKENPKTVVNQMLKRFICYHYWFPDWPDHHSPEDVSLLLDMSLHLLDVSCDVEFQMVGRPKETTKEVVNLVLQTVNTSILEQIISTRGDVEPIPIIHCSAGIGRTGCLAAILNGIRQIRNSILQSLKPFNYQLTSQSISITKSRKNYVAVDILGIVCNLRLQRGGMVQNSEQYELIHRALCLYQSRIDAEFSKWEDKDCHVQNDEISPQDKNAPDS